MNLFAFKEAGVDQEIVTEFPKAENPQLNILFSCKLNKQDRKC